MSDTLPASGTPPSPDHWRDKVSADAWKILFREDTERPFTSPLNDEKRAGTFICAACHQPLFTQSLKFDSGTGWPSFWAPIDAQAVDEKDDRSFFMRRTEVLCSRCDAHLGHVFPDGPQPTGLRYCMNGVALDFRPEGIPDSDEADLPDGPDGPDGGEG